MTENIHLLKVYKKAQYFGLIYHFYNVDDTEGIEIHPGEFQEVPIRPIKKSKDAIYMGLQFLCDQCYNLRTSRLKFYLFPFVNCESIIMTRISIQMFGFSTLAIALSYLLVNPSSWPIVCLIVLAYFILQVKGSFPSIRKCEHLHDEQVRELMREKQQVILDESLLR